MVVAAGDTGARMLYSDEDKIDRFGIHSEPHLKTDWNYRLLLTNNYVCHLLMVEAATCEAVAPLRSKYDGAQDHDLHPAAARRPWPPHEIHHVAEILYHWRKSETSTASRSPSKSYAVEAGGGRRRATIWSGAGSRQVVAPLQQLDSVSSALESSTLTPRSRS